MNSRSSVKEIRAFQRQIRKWFSKNRRSFPWRDTNDPWGILVAEVLLRQTVAQRVGPIYNKVMNLWPTPKAFSHANIRSVKNLIKPLGLHYRAEELRNVARDICDRYDGKVPREKRNLLSIKGIGEYSSSAICSFSFGKREPILDSNILRLLKRVYGIKTPLRMIRPNRHLSQLTLRLLPKKNAGSFNYALLDFTALVCTHYKPKCDNCIVFSLCNSPGAM